MIEVISKLWISSPAITVKAYYEKYRDGADMMYRFKITISKPNGYYYNGILVDLNLNNANVGTLTMRTYSTSAWAYIEQTSGWFRVSNKTTGTTPFNIYVRDHVSGSGATYYTSLGVDPAKSTCSFDNFIIGNNIAVNTNRGNINFTHTLKLYVNGTLITTKNSVGASIIIEPTSGEIEAMYNATSNVVSAQAKIVCTTFSGATNLGDTETNKTATVNTNISTPIFYTFETSDTNPITSALGNDFIKGYSNLKIDIENPAVAINGATMSKYRISVGSFIKEYDYSNPFEITINAITNAIVTVTAIDSRGLETPVNKTLDFLEYTNPIIQSADTQRTSGVDTETFISLSAKIFGGDFDNGTNSVAYFGYRTKESDSETWSSWFDITTLFNIKATNTSGNISLDFDDELPLHENGTSGGFTLGTSYDIQIKLSDGISTQVFNSIQGTTNVNDGKVLEGYFKENGEYYRGYGGMPDENYNHTFYGTLNIFPVGSIYLSVTDTNPSTYFGGTWESWGSGRVPVSVDASDTDFDTVEKTGGAKTHTLTVAEMPSHNHQQIFDQTAGSKWGIGPYKIATQYTGTYENRFIKSAGGGQAHNNLQPYITCYMWKRIA